MWYFFNYLKGWTVKNPIYDGKRNIITPIPFPIEESKTGSVFLIDFVDSDDPFSISIGATKKFKLTIKKLDDINMNSLGDFISGKSYEPQPQAFMALDILFRFVPSMLFTSVGRCFYASDSASQIANGAVLWQGFHQSIKPSRNQMLINLDVSATTFYQPG